MTVRMATADDVSRMIELCELEWRRFAGVHASFYSVSVDYDSIKQQALARLIGSIDSAAFVHEADGSIDSLIVGHLVNSPLVYSAGGKVCLIEDFLVSGSAPWSQIGTELAAAVNDSIQPFDGALMVIESMQAYTEKRNFFVSVRFKAASDWYCRDINLI